MSAALKQNAAAKPVKFPAKEWAVRGGARVTSGQNAGFRLFAKANSKQMQANKRVRRMLFRIRIPAGCSPLATNRCAVNLSTAINGTAIDDFSLIAEPRLFRQQFASAVQESRRCRRDTSHYAIVFYGETQLPERRAAESDRQQVPPLTSRTSRLRIA